MTAINRHEETEAPQVLPIRVTHENLGTVNKNQVSITRGSRTLTLTFSYQTIVGFELRSPRAYEKATIKNYWSVTTGKLLNELCPDHKQRLEREQFDKRLNEAIEELSA